MSKNSDIKATIKSIIENVQLGNKSGTEVAQSVNVWLKEGGEALKIKIEDEVERSVDGTAVLIGRHDAVFEHRGRVDASESLNLG